MLQILLFTVIAVCSAYYLQDTPEVQRQKQNFIDMYNYMARLAAEAPDIHIYSSKPGSVNHFPSYSYNTAIGGSQKLRWT